MPTVEFKFDDIFPDKKYGKITTTHDMSLHEAARWYASELGWSVFPLLPNGKRPLIAKDRGGNGYKDATTNLAQIDKWWSEQPDANIGVSMIGSGLYTVDVDADKGAEWVPPTGEETLTAHTPSGGTHHVYDAASLPDDAKPHIDQDGIDLKHKGYIVVAPSVALPRDGDTPRPYSWATACAPKSSEKVDRLVTKRKGGSRGDGGSDGERFDWANAFTADPVSGQHDHLVRACGSLRAEGMSDRTAVGILTALAGTYTARDTAWPWDAKTVKETWDSTSDWDGRVDPELEKWATSLERNMPESEFWNARPELRTVWQFAKSRGASPWAVLATVLAQVVAATPPSVTLPPIIFGPGTLNQFFAIVGGSSDGKTGAVTVGEEAVVIPNPADVVPIGTGEGLVHTFVHAKKDKSGRSELIQHRLSARVDVDEVDSLAAQQDRLGATVMAYLRQGWSGSRLGRITADKDRNIWAPKLGYRLVLTLGVQPRRAKALFAEKEVAGGTPSRFVWMPAYDPTPTPDDLTEPEPIRWNPPDELTTVDPEYVVGSALAKHEMKVCDLVWRIIRQAHDDRKRRKPGALDGHLLYAQEKVAAGLALLDSRMNISEDDWSLASTIMAKSSEVRREIQKELREQGNESDENQGRREGIRASKRAATVEEQDIKDAIGIIRRRFAEGKTPRDADGWSTWSSVRSPLNRHRDQIEPALTRLVDVGEIELEDEDFEKKPKIRWIA